MTYFNLCVFVVIVMLCGSTCFLNETSVQNTTSTSINTYYEDNYIPDLYYYMYSFSQDVTWDDVFEALNSNSTAKFLSTFNSYKEQLLIYYQLRICPLTSLCYYSLDLYTYYFTSVPCCSLCSCNFPTCLKYNTCCLDILLDNTNVSVVVEDDQDGGNVLGQEIGCLPLYLNPSTVNSTYEKYTGGLMVASCPEYTDERLAKNCTMPYTSSLIDLNKVVPVMNIVNTVVYRNVYCTYCNNVRDNLLAKATATVSCNDGVIPRTEQEIITAVFEHNTCNMIYQGNEQFKIKSCKISIRECNETGRWLLYDKMFEDACERMSEQPVLVNDVFFKNAFCAICNEVNVTEMKCNSVPETNEFTFSGLLKLENYASEGPSKVYNDDEKCSSNQIYDSILNICRDLLCPPMTSLENGACQEIFSEVQSVVYNLYMKIIPSSSTTLMTAYLITESILDYIGNLPIIDYGICGVQVIYHCRENVRYKSYREIKALDIEYFKVRIQVFKKSLHTIHKVYSNLILFHQSRHIISYYDNPTKQMKTFDSHFELDDFNSEMFDVLANLSVSGINKISEFYYPPFEPLPLDIVLDNYTVADNQTGSDIPYISNYALKLEKCTKQLEENNVNFLYYKNCPKILISQGEPHWVPSEDGIQFVEGNFNVSSSELFYDLNKNLIICTRIYEEYLSLFVKAPITAMEIVSIVFSSMSILALSMTLAVFLLVPRLRLYLPGKINMSLVLVLLCAQCMYLICSYAGIRVGSWECIVIGIVLHYLWILSFMWMSISTYHMYHVLTKLKIMSNTPGKCRLLVYHVYGAIMAALPVIINLIVSNNTSGSSGYGETQCYISSQIMIVYTFAIPLGLVMLSNLCMYVMVVCKIKRPTSVQKNVQHERNDLIIFVKLSTITGATWMFGLVYAWTGFTIMSYISIVLNAGQGMFIMYSLILNRRVLNMFSIDVLGRTSTGSGIRAN